MPATMMELPSRTLRRTSLSTGNPVSHAAGLLAVHPLAGHGLATLVTSLALGWAASGSIAWPETSAILDLVELSPFRIERSTRGMSTAPGSCSQAATASRARSVSCSSLSRTHTGGCLRPGAGTPSRQAGPRFARRSPRCIERTGAEEVVVTSCAEEGIFLLYHALLRPGDHVIVETPCYESALQVARSTGAEVSQWRRRYEDGWAHDLDALAGLIRPATRLLYLNQPHNPTGTLMARPVFEQVIGLARAHGLVVFSDEVYRELEHDPARRLPAACDEYERAVSLGSISKSYGLPGLRIGWIAARNAACGTPSPR